MDDTSEKRIDGILCSAFSPKRLKLLLWPRHSAEPDIQLRPTAYLDGVRGFAAFLVYWHHHQLWAHQANGKAEILDNAWGYKGEYHLATFFGIRNFFTGGHMAVAMFFVISGYVLSAKPLRLIQAGEHLKASDNLASALFRRWIRLFLPLIITTFVYVTSWHVLGIWSSASPPKDTWAEDAWIWYTEFKNFSFIFNSSQLWPACNQHLWSIALEMKGSIVIFTSLMAFSRLSTTARLLGQVALIFYFMFISDGWYCALFVSGMLQCDLTLLSRQPDGEYPSFLRRLEQYKTPITWALIFVALYLSGIPADNRDLEVLRANPGWYWLSYLKPQAFFDYKWFYLSIAANCYMIAIPQVSWLKRFYESQFCLYLGRISFSLYLVHGPILSTLGDRLYHAVGYVNTFSPDPKTLAAWSNIFPLPTTGILGLEIAFLLPHLILLPLTIWVADVVTRIVDDPSLRFSSWLYKTAQTYGARPTSNSEDAMRMA
jgi:peptidoglycan/LPS O-acetylase OafA/YrhL